MHKCIPRFRSCISRRGVAETIYPSATAYGGAGTAISYAKVIPEKMQSQWRRALVSVNMHLCVGQSETQNSFIDQVAGRAGSCRRR